MFLSQLLVYKEGLEREDFGFFLVTTNISARVGGRVSLGYREKGRGLDASPEEFACVEGSQIV